MARLLGVVIILIAAAISLSAAAYMINGGALRVMFLSVAGLAAALAAAILILLAFRAARRSAIRKGGALPVPPGIDRLEAVEINGITQWLHIRGRNLANPVLLFLHGGPGGAGIAFGRQMQHDWEEHFTVVQWDQRGGGKTYASNDADAARSAMTVENFVKDGVAVAERLCKLLNKEKIALLGHSWGSYLGLAIAARAPQRISAYVGSGQITHPVEHEAMAYDLVSRIARQRNDRKALKTLNAIPRPPSSAENFRAHNRAINLLYVKYMDEIYGGRASKPNLGAAYWQAVCSPEYTLRDVMNIHRGGAYCLETMYGPASVPGVSSVRHINVADFGTRFEMPILLFLGRYDYACPSEPAAAWLDTITAPVKKVVWFEKSGHSPMSEEPAAYTAALLRELRPLLKD